MFCGKCGVELPEGAKFCRSCGAPVAQRSNDVPSSDALAGMRVKSGGQASTGNGPSTSVKAAARPKINKLTIAAICAAIALVVVAIIALRRPTANSTTTESDEYVSTDEYDTDLDEYVSTDESAIDLDESSQASQSRSFEELEAAFNSGALSESEYVAAVLDHDDVITIKDTSVEQTSFGTVYFAATIVNNSNIYVPWEGAVSVSVDFSYLDEYGDKVELCAEPGKNSIGLAEYAIAEGGNPVSDAFWMRPHEERRVRIMPSDLKMRLKDGQASTSPYHLGFNYVSLDYSDISGIQSRYSINGLADDASRIGVDNFSNLALLPSVSFVRYESPESLDRWESDATSQAKCAETLLGYDTSSLVVTSDNANINISGSITITNNSDFYINEIRNLLLVYTNDKGEPLFVDPVHLDSDLWDIKLLPGDSYVVDVSDSFNLSENLYSSLNSQVDLGQIASVSVYGCDVQIDRQKSETAGLRASLLPR